LLEGLDSRFGSCFEDERLITVTAAVSLPQFLTRWCSDESTPDRVRNLEVSTADMILRNESTASAEDDSYYFL